MKSLLCSFLLVLVLASVIRTAPKGIKDENKESKSVFGPAFDEIVVESSLTVRRKPPGRQGRNQNATATSVRVAGGVQTPNRTKRQALFHPISNKPLAGSASNSQSQAFNSFGPLGSFGASATGAQTQSFSTGPKDLFASGALSGTQQYNFNGQTIDIAFGNSFSGDSKNSARGGGAAITITDQSGKKRPFSG